MVVLKMKGVMKGVMVRTVVVVIDKKDGGGRMRRVRW